LRGAYFTDSASTSKSSGIDFFVLDPDRKVIYSRRKRAEGIFSVNLTAPGEYSFVFSNLKVRLKFVY